MRPNFMIREDSWHIYNIFKTDYNWWFSTNEITQSFTDLPSSNSALIKVEVSMDRLYEHYKRQRFNLQNWLIEVGGISRGLFIACLIAAQSFSKFLYRGDIINSLFMSRQDLDDVEI